MVRLPELWLGNFKLGFSATTERVYFAIFLSLIDENNIVFHRLPSSYPDADHKKFFLWYCQTDAVEELPERVAHWTTGTENGRFSARRDFGYTIIDSLKDGSGGDDF